MGGNYEKGLYNQLMEVMARLDAVEEDLHVEKIEHKNDVDRLNAKIDCLTEENRLLKDDNARLKSIINNDSSNTSLPPFTDQKGGKPANTYNSCQHTGRKAGGQKGHKGTTLTKEEVEEKIRSGKCRHEVREIGDPSSQKYVTKYVVDLDVTPMGTTVKALSTVLYSEGVMSNDRIAAFLNAAGNGELGLSAGSVYGFCRKFASNAEGSIQNLETELLNQEVVLTDATTVTVNGEQNYVRNFSIGKTVIYRAMKSKAIDALKKIDFLKKLSGILVHDHETALYHFGTDHGECNVHIIRYLRKNTEETGHGWSVQMKDLLCEMNRERKKLADMGEVSFPEETLHDYEKRYMDLIASGRRENKQPGRRFAKKDEKALLNRLEKYMHNHLLFLHDFRVPFDDNMSERDLRKVKNRQKMAGGFRKDSGHEMYCAILTIIETLKRRNMGLVENAKKLFMGAPAIF